MNIKNRFKSNSGAALIEALIVVPFLITIIILTVSFMDFVRNYSLSSQIIRESAQIGAMFTKSGFSSSFCTCILNQRDQGGCVSQCRTTQGFESLQCNRNDTDYNINCAHQAALSKIRAYFASVSISEQLVEANLTTEVVQIDNDVIFKAKLTGEHESIYEVFGGKQLEVESFAFMRHDDIPEPDPSPEESESDEEPEEEDEPIGNPDGPGEPGY